MTTADEVRTRIRELENLIPQLQGELISLRHHPAIQSPAWTTTRIKHESCNHPYIEGRGNVLHCMICDAVIPKVAATKKKSTKKD